MTTALAKKLKNLPSLPGVYLLKNSREVVLYVGKAIKLRSRVNSYFQKGSKLSLRIHQMVNQVQALDFIVTDNELESLVLENNLIKQHRPKYNVRLRDDKNYLFLKINLQDEIPTIEWERKITDRKARYLGPYTSSQSIKATLRLIRRIFPYCSNSKISNKPCFYYHIGKCPGVCIGKISPLEYRKTIQKIIKFLEGEQGEVIIDLQRQMRLLAQNRQYEKAAKTRDQIFALNRIWERQKLVSPKKVSQDIFSIYQDGVSCINLFLVREGKLIQKENFVLENTKQADPSEILEGFLSRYYLETSNWPKEILLPVKIDEAELKVAFDKLRQQKELTLKRKSKGQLKILVPFRGPKLKLVRLGEENAKQYLETLGDKQLLEDAKLLASLKELARVLFLPKLPGRIEAYDISNIQGTSPVGSMVVFDFGRPKKQDYRKFKITTKTTPDDFAMMREMLERRFRRTMTMTDDNDRTVNSHGQKSAVRPWPIPDLILIDGGKGQLSTALKVLKTYKLKIPALGLAKRLEEIFLPNRKQALRLPQNSAALFLLQRIRDEAHRFAINYHRKLRIKTGLSSKLDTVPGIGLAKKKLLLQRFESTRGLASASLTEIANIVGTKLAEKIKASL